MRIRLRSRGRRKRVAPAAGIEKFFQASPHRRLIVRGTTLAGTLLAMLPPAAERTTQVPATCVAGMSQKANPTVQTVNDAPLKLGMGLQDRVQPSLILPDKRLGAIALMPICPKREKLLDGDGKKAKLSVILPMFLDTPSSYLIDAKASRGRARFFLRHDQESAKTVRTNGPLPITPPAHSPCRANPDALRAIS